MTRLLLILFLGSSALASEVRVFMWQESRAEKTGEAQVAFFVASKGVKEVFEAEARGEIEKSAELAKKLPPDAWMYGVVLRGATDSYPKEKIGMFRGHDLVDVSSGSITVAPKNRSVLIALEILEDGKAKPFPGNGRFTFTERPKP